MPENERTSLEVSLGHLTGLVEANLNSTKDLVRTQEEQTKKLQTIELNTAVLKTTFDLQAVNCNKKFCDTDEKLNRDFKRLNELEKTTEKDDVIHEYKKSNREKIAWTVGIISTIIAILATLSSFKSEKDTSSVYGASVNKIDSLRR